MNSTAQQTRAFPTYEANTSTRSRSLAIRWGSQQLFEDGFLGLPNALLRNYTEVGISTSEFVFILQLMSFKWSEAAPFPSYKTIAQRMAITTEMARRHAQSLEKKGLLRRVKRTGRSNEFDLRPFTAAIEMKLAAKAATAKAAA